MALRCGKLPALVGLVCLAASVSVAATAASTKSPTTKKSAHHKRTHHAKVRGQKAIDADRAREIQEALIREHYLKGQPTGKWDAQTQQAMQRYQAAQGWQSKLVPDSRALIRLGLGPDHEHLLNPDSAMTTGPATPRVENASAKSSTKSSSAKALVPVSASMPATSVGVAPAASTLSTVPAH
jgi:hypothetical protein